MKEELYLPSLSSWAPVGVLGSAVYSAPLG